MVEQGNDVLAKTGRKGWRVPFVAALFLAAVSGGAYSYSKWDEWTVWPELRKPMLNALKDPESAQFRNQFVGRQALCGEVNARNSMGGYTGYARFIATGQRFVIEHGGMSSWTNKSDDVKALMAALDKELELMRTLNRKPSNEELNTALFKDLWRERCEGLS